MAGFENTHRPRCEVCEDPGTLIGCSGPNDPHLWFCPEHYIEHVKEAHDGEPLPGCRSLKSAQKMALHIATGAPIL